MSGIYDELAAETGFDSSPVEPKPKVDSVFDSVMQEVNAVPEAPPPRPPAAAPATTPEPTPEPAPPPDPTEQFVDEEVGKYKPEVQKKIRESLAEMNQNPYRHFGPSPWGVAPILGTIRGAAEANSLNASIRRVQGEGKYTEESFPQSGKDYNDRHIENIARDIGKKAYESKQGFVGRLGSAALRLPGVGGEIAMAAPLAAGAYGINAGANVLGAGIAGARATGFLAGTGVLTTALPGFWLEDAITKNTENGRDSLDPRGLAPAFLHGFLELSILGTLGKLGTLIKGASVPAFVARTAVRGGAMTVEQAAADVVSGSLDLQTHYGTIGDLLQGKWKKAGQDAALQFLTGAAFGIFHDIIHGAPPAKLRTEPKPAEAPPEAAPEVPPEAPPGEPAEPTPDAPPAGPAPGLGGGKPKPHPVMVALADALNSLGKRGYSMKEAMGWVNGIATEYARAFKDNPNLTRGEAYKIFDDFAYGSMGESGKKLARALADTLPEVAEKVAPQAPPQAQKPPEAPIRPPEAPPAAAEPKPVQTPTMAKKAPPASPGMLREDLATANGHVEQTNGRVAKLEAAKRNGQVVDKAEMTDAKMEAWEAQKKLMDVKARMQEAGVEPEAPEAAPEEPAAPAEVVPPEQPAAPAQPVIEARSGVVPPEQAPEPAMPQFASFEGGQRKVVMAEPEPEPVVPKEPDVLTEQERYVIDQRRSGRILQSIGDELGVSRERVRQIEAAAKAKLEPGGKQKSVAVENEEAIVNDLLKRVEAQRARGVVPLGDPNVSPENMAVMRRADNKIDAEIRLGEKNLEAFKAEREAAGGELSPERNQYWVRRFAEEARISAGGKAPEAGGDQGVAGPPPEAAVPQAAPEPVGGAAPSERGQAAPGGKPVRKPRAASISQQMVTEALENADKEGIPRQELHDRVAREEEALRSTQPVESAIKEARANYLTYRAAQSPAKQKQMPTSLVPGKIGGNTAFQAHSAVDGFDQLAQRFQGEFGFDIQKTWELLSETPEGKSRGKLYFDALKAAIEERFHAETQTTNPWIDKNQIIAESKELAKGAQEGAGGGAEDVGQGERAAVESTDTGEFPAGERDLSFDTGTFGGAEAVQPPKRPGRAGFIQPLNQEQVNAIHDSIKDGFTLAADSLARLSGYSFPALTRLNNKVGEAAVRYAAAPALAQQAKEVYPDLVLGRRKNLVDSLRERMGFKPGNYVTEEFEKLVGSAIQEMRFRSYKAKLAAIGSPEALAEAAQVSTVFGMDDSQINSEAEFQAALSNPQVLDVFHKYRILYVPFKEDMTRLSKGIDPGDPIENISQIDGMPFRAMAVQEEEPPSGFGGGSLAAATMRRNTSLRRAHLGAEAYEFNFRKIMENDIEKSVKTGTQGDAYRTAVEQGVGYWGTPGDAREGYDMVNPFADPQRGTQENQPGDKVFFILDKGAGEWHRLGRTDKVEEWEKIAGAVTAIPTGYTLMAAVEALTHGSNLAMGAVFGPWRVPDKLAANIYGRVMNTPEFRLKMVDLARKGQMKKRGLETGTMIDLANKLLGPFGSKLPHEVSYIDPTYYGGQLLDLIGDVVRVTHADVHEALVGEGAVEDTQTSQTNLVNRQSGQYNALAQHGLVNWLRRTGIGPFAVAATHMTIRAFKIMYLFDPGVRGKTWGQTIKLRGEVALKLAGAFGLIALWNWYKWGRWDGDDNTPLFSIKIGEEDGKTKYMDFGPMALIRRALRVSTALAQLEGRRKGESEDKIRQNMQTDVIHAIAHPFQGPVVNFATTALTGEDAMGNKLSQEHPLPEGSTKWEERFRAALGSANPVRSALTAKDREGNLLPLHERQQRLLGPLGVKYREQRPVELGNFYDQWNRMKAKHDEYTKAVRVGMNPEWHDQYPYKQMEIAHSKLASLNRELKGEQPGGMKVQPTNERKKEIREEQRMAIEMAFQALR